jgi:hypothetical protein
MNTTLWRKIQRRVQDVGADQSGISDRLYLQYTRIELSAFVRRIGVECVGALLEVLEN